MEGDGEGERPDVIQGAESVSPGAANVKVVHPVPRELNPNAKPFRSAKLELRSLLLQQGRSHDSDAADEVSNRELGTQSRSNRAAGPGAGRSGHSSPFLQNDMNSRAENELITKFSRWKFPTEASTAADRPSSSHNSWNTRGYQSPTLNFSSRLTSSTRAGTSEYSRDSPGFANAQFENNAASNSIDLLIKINNRLEEQTRFQAVCSRQLQKLDRKLGVVTTRLDTLEERRRESLNSFDSVAYGGQRGNSSSSKGYFGMNTEGAEYWDPYDNFRPSQVSAGDQEDIFSTGSEGTLRNNLTLNNQVPPGTRANNFYDNFRSYSQQNLLSAPKNIPGTVTVSRERESNSSAGTSHSGLFDQSRPRDSSSGSGVWTSRKSGTPRNSFRGTEFVENIGTKLRNQEQELPTHSRSPMRRNDNSGSSIRSRSPQGRDRDSVGSMFGVDAEGDSLKSIMDVISVFLERNGNRPSFIFSLFERLTEVRTDFERSEILHAVDAILRSGNTLLSCDNVQHELQSPHNIPFLTRLVLDGESTAQSSHPLNEAQGRARGVLLSDFGQPSSSAHTPTPLQFAFGNRYHRPGLDSPSYQNNLKFKSRDEPGKVRPMGISPEFGLPRDRSSIEPMRTPPEDEYFLDPMLDLWTFNSRDGWGTDPAEVGGRSRFFNSDQSRSSEPSTVPGAEKRLTGGEDEADTLVRAATVNDVAVDDLLPGVRSNYFLPMDSPLLAAPDDPEPVESDDENQDAGDEEQKGGD